MAGFIWFKAGANLHDVKVSGEPVSADMVAAEEFPEKLWKITDEGAYLTKQVFKVDETGLYWNRMPDQGYIRKEETLKPLLVHHSENPRALKNKAMGSLPVVWKSNPKPRVTQVIFQDWFFHHLILQVEKYCLE